MIIDVIYYQHISYLFVPTSCLQFGHKWTRSLQSSITHGIQNNGQHNINTIQEAISVWSPTLVSTIVPT